MTLIEFQHFSLVLLKKQDHIFFLYLVLFLLHYNLVYS
nr:MAG TPA: hypothetical protein [Caudoviricetes sp.]DAZ41929.1 MAG TPA: hypothetical protein [Caudoviricetes sp.]